MRSKKPETVKRVVNLLAVDQIQAIADGVEQSAFTVTMSSGDDVVATLSSAGVEVFRIDLTNRTITRKRDNNVERAYVCPPHRFFSFNHEEKIWERLERVIRSQYAISSHEAATANLITRHEVVVLIDAIKAMAFKIDRSLVANSDEYILYFDGREVFRISIDQRTISLVGLSKASELVYTFVNDPESWFWSGTDRKLWQELVTALDFYNATMHRVRMADYRALFGNQIQKVIAGLAVAMEEAEADARLIERIDKTNSGRNLHPDVARLVQKDLEAGEEAAADGDDDQGTQQ
jgi:hypothetical protein